MSRVLNPRIGGSDIGKLLGTSRYGNAADVYLRVVEGMDDEWNPRMERGAVVEPHLRAIGQSKFGFTLETVASDYHDHPTLGFARAQIDDLARFRGMPVVVDYKSQSRWAKGWGADGSDDVPEGIAAQVAWEMACADRDLAILLVGFGEDDKATGAFEILNVVSYEVQRCPEFESYCIAVAKEFWEAHVVPRVPPDMAPIGKKKRKAA